MTARLLGLVLLTAVAGTTLTACGGKENATPEATTAAGAVPFDRAFIDAMVPHHQSAIVMARAALTAGLSQPDLIKIANDIVATQQVEIDDMRAWRQTWFGSTVIDPRGPAVLGLSMEERGMQHDADYAGVDDVDQAFASAMTDHHRGAIRMAELALEQGQHAEITELAKTIIAAQEREISIMEAHAGAMQHGG